MMNFVSCRVVFVLWSHYYWPKYYQKCRKIPKWTAWPKFTRVEPLLRQTGCVSRRHHTSVQGWGSTSHPQTTPAVLWWPPWSAAPSLHGLTMTSTYATSLGMHRRWSDPRWTQVSLFISVFYFNFFANISVLNKSKITKQRRPDSLRNASWRPAIWVVNMFVNVENKPT